MTGPTRACRLKLHGPLRGRFFARFTTHIDPITRLVADPSVREIPTNTLWHTALNPLQSPRCLCGIASHPLNSE